MRCASSRGGFQKGAFGQKGKIIAAVGWAGRVGLVENGSWAPAAGKIMKALVESMKGMTLAEPMVSLRSAMKREQEDELKALASALASPEA